MSSSSTSKPAPWACFCVCDGSDGCPPREPAQLEVRRPFDGKPPCLEDFKRFSAAHADAWPNDTDEYCQSYMPHRRNPRHTRPSNGSTLSEGSRDIARSSRASATGSSGTASSSVSAARFKEAADKSAETSIMQRVTTESKPERDSASASSDPGSRDSTWPSGTTRPDDTDLREMVSKVKSRTFKLRHCAVGERLATIEGGEGVLRVNGVAVQPIRSFDLPSLMAEIMTGDVMNRSQRQIEASFKAVQAMHACMRALSEAGVATVGRKITEAGLWPVLDLALEAQHGLHWTDFRSTWEAEGVDTKDIYNTLLEAGSVLERLPMQQIGDPLTISGRFLAASVSKAFHKVIDKGNQALRKLGWSINVHPIPIDAKACLSWMRWPRLAVNPLVLSITTWDKKAGAPRFPDGATRDIVYPVSTSHGMIISSTSCHLVSRGAKKALERDTKNLDDKLDLVEPHTGGASPN